MKTPWHQKALSKKQIFGISVGIVAVIILLASLGGDENSSPSSNPSSSNQPQGSQSVSVGEAGLLNNNSDPSQCSGKSIIALTEDAYEEVVKAAVAKDNYSGATILLEGRAVLRPNCTKALVIDSGVGKRKIRLTEEPEIAGWVPVEWVKPISQ